MKKRVINDCHEIETLFSNFQTAVAMYPDMLVVVALIPKNQSDPKRGSLVGILLGRHPDDLHRLTETGRTIIFYAYRGQIFRMLENGQAVPFEEYPELLKRLTSPTSL